jgi:hypothetical protein
VAAFFKKIGYGFAVYLESRHSAQKCLVAVCYGARRSAKVRYVVSYDAGFAVYQAETLGKTTAPLTPGKR